MVPMHSIQNFPTPYWIFFCRNIFCCCLLHMRLADEARLIADSCSIWASFDKDTPRRTSVSIQRENLIIVSRSYEAHLYLVENNSMYWMKITSTIYRLQSRWKTDQAAPELPDSAMECHCCWLLPYYYWPTQDRQQLRNGCWHAGPRTRIPSSLRGRCTIEFSCTPFKKLFLLDLSRRREGNIVI